MTSFYKCEIEGSVSNKVFTCYALCDYYPEKGETKFNADLRIENKLIKYFDENLSVTFGEFNSINIMTINPDEYYGIKKSNKYLFIE